MSGWIPYIPVIFDERPRASSYIPGVSPPRHLYIHVPFCARRCSYCDFSIAVRPVVPVDEYVNALTTELELQFRDAAPWEVDTIYFGGGTPSRLGGPGIARLLDALRRRVSQAPGAEVTLEANPEDVTPAAAAEWRAAGVTRVSLGSQSFDDKVLTWMHRTHDASAIPKAVDTLRRAGIQELSLDLIFALPGELNRDWADDLRQAVELEPDHLSLYGLTVEPATPLFRWRARGLLREAPDQRYEAEFLLAHQALESHGFEHYEVSNYARPGRQARHNSAYWSGAAYAGLGPSAHGFDGRTRRWNLAAYVEWLRTVGKGRDPLGGSEVLTAENRADEAVYLGLRTARGLPLNDGERLKLQAWLDQGWAVATGDGRLCLTALGWLRLDALAEYLTVVRSRS